MPSGRDIYTIKPYVPPSLDPSTILAMRAPPSPSPSLPLDSLTLRGGAAGKQGEGDSSDDENDGGGGGRDGRFSGATTVVGAFPGTREDYASAGSPAPGGVGGYY